MNRGDTLRGVFVRHRWRLLLAVALLLLTMLASSKWLSFGVMMAITSAPPSFSFSPSISARPEA